jgi:hypothetical protein
LFTNDDVEFLIWLRWLVLSLDAFAFSPFESHRRDEAIEVEKEQKKRRLGTGKRSFLFLLARFSMHWFFFSSTDVVAIAFCRRW